MIVPSVFYRKGMDLDKLNESGTDLIELRVDKIRSIKAIEAIKQLRKSAKPLMVTFRSLSEGGYFTSDPAIRKRYIDKVLEAGVSYIDVEYSNDFRNIEHYKNNSNGAKVVVSVHSKKNLSYRDIKQIIHKSIGDYIKIVFPVRDIGQALKLIYLKEAYYNKKLTFLSSGRCNEFFRIMSAGDSNAFSFGYVDGEERTSEGQMNIEHLKSIGKYTQYFGLIGWPLRYTLSPYYFAQLSSMHSVSSVYMPLPLKSSKSLGMVIENLHQLNFRGVNITTPYKKEIISSVDNMDPVAEESESVSLIMLDNLIKGFNLDYYALRNVISRRGITPEKVLVLGTGATSRTAILLMKHLDCSVYVKSHRKENLRHIAEKFGVEEGKDLVYDAIINGTTVGYNVKDFPYKLPATAINGIAIDFVYREEGETPFLHIMKKRGVQTIDGKEIVKENAKLSFEKWFNLI